jgi:periplasmic divalent cation tolerance protein
VESKAAACVQVSGPVCSVYRWKGEVRREEEWVCTMKTTESSLDALLDLVEQNHPYETPEIVVTEVYGASRAYLDWAREVTT